MPFTAAALMDAAAIQLETYRRQLEDDRIGFGQDQVAYNARPIVKPAAVTGKCPCCGSREFRTHASLRVCAYCRAPMDGQALHG